MLKGRGDGALENARAQSGCAGSAAAGQTGWKNNRSWASLASMHSMHKTLQNFCPCLEIQGTQLLPGCC
eukprot:363048-Chlamydomonas_euryale.AAC.1